MLFTDERPNTGATDAESFMGMAENASHGGIGLTTIGVGVQFGAELATKISSVRGGNLYFIRDAADIKTLFTGQLDYMVSELALRSEAHHHAPRRSQDRRRVRNSRRAAGLAERNCRDRQHSRRCFSTITGAAFSSR